MINKRYKDIFEQYIHKGESTPLTIGTLVICALCFLMILIATFTQITFSHPWFEYIKGTGFAPAFKNVVYTPQIPVMIFIIYILGRKFSYLTFITYLIMGFFIWPVFIYGGGLDYIQNYLFGYLIGFVFAVLLSGTILKYSQSIKFRLLAAIVGVITIHIVGFIYCIILAIFRVIDFGLIFPIASAMSGKFFYDVIFSSIALMIAPYIKNIFWICMKPKPTVNKPKKPKKSRRKKLNNQLSH